MLTKVQTYTEGKFVEKVNSVGLCKKSKLGAWGGKVGMLGDL